MNIHYISGFFDADGSITMAKDSSSAIFRTIKIDFTNTKRSILLEIQQFLREEYEINSYIVTKPSKNENWTESYSLTINSNQTCYKLCQLLDSHHPIKRHRINTVLKYHNSVTKRNGKYTDKERMRKLAYERLFFSTIFQ